MRYTVEISDDAGNTCQFALKIPFAERRTNVGNSSWKLLTPGAVAHRSGGCEANSTEFFGPTDILLVFKARADVKLLAMFDGNDLVNSSGEGILAPSTSTGVITPGPIGWTLVS